MTQNRDLAKGNTIPESWLDAIQEFISTMSANLKLEKASDTSVQIVAAAGNDQVTIGVMGRWRYRTTTIAASMPGTPAAADYDVYVTGTDNSFTGSGAAEVDNTVYAFGLEIRTTGVPTTALYRKVGTVTWDGAKITDVRQTVGSATLVKHASQHAPLGSDPLDFALVGAAINLRGTFASRPAAAVGNAGKLYFSTDTQIIYRSYLVSSGPDVYAWEVWAGVGTGKAIGTIGNGSLTVIDFVHNLGTRDVVVSVREASSPYSVVYPEVQTLDTNTVRLIFAVAPTSGQYTVTAIGGNAQAIATHGSSHQPGGSDPMAVDAAAGTGSLRTLGAGATQAAAGNDARLSDARTPSAHAASHHPQTGGDRITMSLSGTLAGRPAASAVVAGTIYRATDALTYQSDGASVWSAITVAVPRVKLRQVAAQNIGYNADTVMDWNASDAEDYDSEAMHDPTTNSTRITVVTAGLFHLTAQVVFADPAEAGSYGVKIRKNGTTILAWGAGTTNQQGANCCIDDVAIVNDYYEMLVKQVRASATALNTSDPTSFSAYRVTP